MRNQQGDRGFSRGARRQDLRSNEDDSDQRSGRALWSPGAPALAQAQDPAAVKADEAPAKTIGHGKVIPPDTRDRQVLGIYYMHMAEKVARRLRKNSLEAQVFSISLKTELTRIGIKSRTVGPTADGAAIYALAVLFLDRCWSGVGGFQIQITALDPRPAARQSDMFEACDPRRDELNAAVDRINERFGAYPIHKAPLVGRSEMPDVIAPGWRPNGHRESIDY